MALLHNANTYEEKLLTQLLNNDVWRKQVLLTVKHIQQDFTLAKLYVSAGFIRNLYWDYAHGFVNSTPLNDVDVVYFDGKNLSEQQDRYLEKKLNTALPNVKWSVKNQARMHHKSGHVPYTSLADALSNWVETATAIGVHVNPNNHLNFLAPWGFSDLFSLILRPTPYFIDQPEIFLGRVKQKNWLQHWNGLEVKGI